MRRLGASAPQTLLSPLLVLDNAELTLRNDF